MEEKKWNCRGNEETRDKKTKGNCGAEVRNNMYKEQEKFQGCEKDTKMKEIIWEKEGIRIWN